MDWPMSRLLVWYEAAILHQDDERSRLAVQIGEAASVAFTNPDMLKLLLPGQKRRRLQSRRTSKETIEWAAGIIELDRVEQAQKES